MQLGSPDLTINIGNPFILRSKD